MDPALFCKLFFNLGTAVDLGGVFIPYFRENIMDYGARHQEVKLASNWTDQTFFARLVKWIASFQVPHSWFTHYYAISVLSSIFWASQIYSQSAAFRILASYSAPSARPMSVNQVGLAWLLMAIQGARRLYESTTLTKPSKAKMWIGLWIVGSAYYLCIGIAVWIDGISALNKPGSLFNHFEFSWPSIKTCFAIPMFISASVIQHVCHKHLASLKKYSLPQHPLFRSVVCPHYTSECIIYSAIAIAAAPKGQFVNQTVLAGIGFVVSNLAVTAGSTRTWYVEKFGAEKLKGRWRMVPYVY